MNSDKPDAACRGCWLSWATSIAPLRVGFCWHGKVAWRRKPRGQLVTFECSRDEYRELLRQREGAKP